MSKAFSKTIQSYVHSNHPVTTGFLTPKEQEITTQIDPAIVFDGGYKNAIRQRAYFYTHPADDIVCFKIHSASSFLHLSHRNMLGSLMGLGLNREDIGDILHHDACFFVTKAVSKQVKYGLISIGKHPITLESIDGHDLIPTINFEDLTVIVSSMRLDVVVKAIAHISRQQSVHMIQNNLVKVNDFVVDKQTKLLKVDDVLSIRHHGRFVLDAIEKRTKKDKIVINIKKYA
jgi:RNA-binding protein YlmH